METLPDGVVTFLFTDVEGSTRLWEEAPDSMMEALLFTDHTPISDLALAELEALQREMDPGEYADAHAAGAARSYGLVAKELIDTISSTPVAYHRPAMS